MSKLIPFCLILLSTFAAADDVPRTISVGGQGSVETPPDRATLILSIVARDTSVARAQAEAAEVTARVDTRSERFLSKLSAVAAAKTTTMEKSIARMAEAGTSAFHTESASIGIRIVQSG